MARFSFLILLFYIPLQAQPIIWHPESEEALPDKWEWAHQQGEGSTYWVGYRIEKLMKRRSFYGMFKGAGVDQATALYTLIGEPEKFDSALKDVHSGWRFNGYGSVHFHGNTKEEENEWVLKELAILIQYKDKTPTQVLASNMSLEVDMEEAALYWLDYTDKPESISLLQQVYRDLQRNEPKEDLVSVLGFHGQNPEVEKFLTQVLRQSRSADIRERAVWELGRQETESSLATLQYAIQSDPSDDVREHAIFALSSMDMQSAQNVLIDLVRNERRESLRRKAISALGQKASNKALEVLEETIYDEANAAVQKHAVYTLTQFNAETAVPRLIEIAHTHPSSEVRKSAIYALGNIGNDEAVEALIRIVESQ